MATIFLSTAKPRRKKEVLDNSPTAYTPNGTSPAHLAPKGTNRKFLGNRYLATAPPFRRQLSGVGIARSGKIFHSCHSPVPRHLAACGKLHSCDEGFRPTWESIAQDTGLVGRDDLIENASPASFAGNQGRRKIRQVQERDEGAEDNINPRLPHDLRTRIR